MKDSIKEIENSIAYCGLICKLCHLSSTCEGCKSNSGCEKWAECEHRRCCIEKGINGCKESEEEVIALLREGELSRSRKENPYEKCPIYETKKFIFRMVDEKDAIDLLECYSDDISAKLFNSDNCTSDFVYKSLEEMKECIKFWIDEYYNRCYIRFSIIDKLNYKAIGTIELFPRTIDYNGEFKIGILRLDLASKYENEKTIIEILELVKSNFYDDFQVKHIITKAIPVAKQRIAALNKEGFIKLEDKDIAPFDFYYVIRCGRDN